MSIIDVTAPKRQLVQKLGYGQGSIYLRQNARGEIAYLHVYYDGTKQHEVRLNATTLAAARKECASRNTRKDEGKLVAPTMITFGQVTDEFLSMQRGLVEEGRRSARTIQLYEQRYEHQLKPALGSKKFQGISPQNLSRLLVELRGKDGRRGKMSGNTRAGILRLASSIFSFGVSRGYRTDSPNQFLASQERPESKPVTKARALSDEECSKLILATRPGLKDFVTFLAFTGVRLSEGLVLRWENVDLDAGIVTVEFQLDRWADGETPKLKKLKSDNGYRTVDLHPALVTVLRKRRQDALANGLHRNDYFVFSTEDGRPLSHRNTARDIERAAIRAGLNGEGQRPVSAHMLRHTFASRLIALPLNVVEVARQLGDRPETLMRVYAQAFNDARRRDEIRTKIAQGTHIALGR